MTLTLTVSDRETSLENLKRAVVEAGAQVDTIESRGLSGVAESILIVSAGAHTLVHVLGALKRMFRHGLIIDATDEDRLVRSDPSVPTGVIVIRGPDGDVKVQQDEPVPSAALRLLTERSKPK